MNEETNPNDMTDTSAENTSAENTSADNTWMNYTWVAENTSVENTSADNTSGDNTSADNTSADNTSADNTSGNNTSGNNTPTDRSKVVLETPVCRTVSIMSFTLRVIDLVFGESVRFAIILECKCHEQIYTEYKELSVVGDEYRRWGTDDEYMINLVKSKLPTLV